MLKILSLTLTLRLFFFVPLCTLCSEEASQIITFFISFTFWAGLSICSLAVKYNKGIVMIFMHGTFHMYEYNTQIKSFLNNSPTYYYYDLLVYCSSSEYEEGEEELLFQLKSPPQQFAQFHFTVICYCCLTITACGFFSERMRRVGCHVCCIHTGRNMTNAKALLIVAWNYGPFKIYAQISTWLWVIGLPAVGREREREPFVNSRVLHACSQALHRGRQNCSEVVVRITIIHFQSWFLRWSGQTLTVRIYILSALC